MKLCPSKGAKNFEVEFTWPFCLPPYARFLKAEFFSALFSETLKIPCGDFHLSQDLGSLSLLGQ